MRIKSYIFVGVLAMLSAMLLAHTPLMFIDDNQDGTIYVEAGFSDGSSAAGMTCRLEDSEGNTLWEGVFDRFGSITVEIPEVGQYDVVFDGGPGHTIRRPGPVLRGPDPEDEKVVMDLASAGLDQSVQDPISDQGAPIAIPSWLTNQTLYAHDQGAIKEELIRIQGWLIAIAFLLLLIAISLLILAFRKGSNGKSGCH